MEHLRTNQRTKKVYLISQICSTDLYIKLIQSFDLINLSALLQLKDKLMNDLISSLSFAKKLRRSWENNIWLTGPAYSNKSSNIQIAHCRSVGGLAGTWINVPKWIKKKELQISNFKLAYWYQIWLILNHLTRYSETAASESRKSLIHGNMGMKWVNYEGSGVIDFFPVDTDILSFWLTWNYLFRFDSWHCAYLICYFDELTKLLLGCANKKRQTIDCSGEINIYVFTPCVQGKEFKEYSLVIVAKFLVLSTCISW